MKNDINLGIVNKNPFSFNGKSNRTNYLIYGIILPLLIIISGVMLLKIPLLGIVLVVIGSVMAMSSMVRRGHDIGMTAILTFVLYLVSSTLFGVILSISSFPTKLFSLLGSIELTHLATLLLSSVFVFYLLLLPSNNKEASDTTKIVKITVGIIVAITIGLSVIDSLMSIVVSAVV